MDYSTTKKSVRNKLGSLEQSILKKEKPVSHNTVTEFSNKKSIPNGTNLLTQDELELEFNSDLIRSIYKK